MKIIVLSEDAVIEDVFYRKGEVVKVPDDYSDAVLKTLVTPEEQAKREKDRKDKIKKVKNGKSE